MSKAQDLTNELKQLTNDNKAIRAKMRAVKKQLVAELNRMPYQEYLLTSHWKGIRRKALKKAHNTCQLCGNDSDTLNVHHNTYERRGRERMTDVIVLCQSCHAKHHDK